MKPAIYLTVIFVETLMLGMSPERMKAWADVFGGFELTERSDVAGVAVPLVRPSGTGNIPIAFDVMPRGHPTSDFVDNGIAWHDTCNVDVLAYPDDPVRCIRMAIKAAGAEIRSVGYNGASPDDIVIKRGNTIIARFTSAGIRAKTFIQDSSP